MEKDIRKIKEAKLKKIDSQNCEELLRAWHNFIAALRECDDEDFLYKMLAYEVQHRNRPAVLDRIRARYNKVRAYRELKELEEVAGAIINVNYV